MPTLKFHVLFKQREKDSSVIKIQNENLVGKNIVSECEIGKKGNNGKGKLYVFISYYTY